MYRAEKNLTRKREYYQLLRKVGDDLKEKGEEQKRVKEGHYGL